VSAQARPLPGKSCWKT